MATGQERMLGEAASFRPEWRVLFDHLSEGLAYCQMLFDEHDRPIDWVYLDVNAAFERLTGLRKVCGKRVTEVIPGLRETQPELFETYGRIARGGKPETFEIHVKPSDLWLSISAFSPVRGCFVAVFDKSTDRKQAERFQAMSVEILGILNNPLALDDAITRILAVIKQELDFEAVGLRLKRGEDFPYVSAAGFSQDFLLAEGSLVARTADGGFCRDADGKVSLECTCGLVVAGRTDPANATDQVAGSWRAGVGKTRRLIIKSGESRMPAFKRRGGDLNSRGAKRQ